MAAEEPFSVSVIIPSRGRLNHLVPRIPLWAQSGFDEVIVVDGSYDLDVRRKTQELCKAFEIKYVAAPRRLRDMRSLQRNLGAQVAKSEWIYFQDDDDDVIRRIRRDVLASAARGVDWLVGPAGEHLMMQRRAAFLEFGGYPEDMVAAEDMIMSNRARGHGKGGRLDNWYDDVVTPTRPSDDPISRARNAFWYGATVLLFMMRAPHRKPVVIGDFRRIAILARNALRGELRAFVLLATAATGRLVSPLHTLLVWLRGGRRALSQEPYYGWQGLR